MARKRLLGLAALAIGFVVAPLVLPVTNATELLVFGLVAVAANLLIGVAGLFSFGQAALFGVGGYVGGWLLANTELPMALPLLAGAAAGAVLGAIMGALCVRRAGMYFIMLTFAFNQMIYYGAYTWREVTGGEDGLNGITRPAQLFPGAPAVDFGKGLNFYILVAVLVFVCFVLLLRVVDSPLGRILQAARESPRRAASIGYDIHRAQTLAFAISGFFTGLAGVLYGMTYWIMPIELGALAQFRLHRLYGADRRDQLDVRADDRRHDLHPAPGHSVNALGALAAPVWPRGYCGRDVPARRGHRAVRAKPHAVAADGAAPGGRVAASHRGAAMTEPLLRVEGLTKVFGAHKAVSGISLEVAAGELLCIIGPNGAGKTTLFNLLTKDLSPTAGRIWLSGDDVTGARPHQISRRGVGRSYQITSVFQSMTVFDNVWTAAYRHDEGGRLVFWRRSDAYEAVSPRVDEVLAAVGLAHYRDALAAELSYGDQRLLEIAVTLATAPRLLLLDEPTSGLSQEETRKVSSLIRELSARATVVMIEHKMDVVMQISDRLAVMNFGRVIAEGRPEDVARDPEVRRAYLGT